LACCTGELHADANGSPDAAAPQSPGAGGGGALPRQLDLLFLIDNSSSMYEEQSALRREFPRLIDELVGGARPLFDDLHIGVASSDLGADPHVRGCEMLGDDARLRSDANPARDATLQCHDSYPSFLAYSGGASGVEALSGEFACMAALGSQGCGFEQHLEVALKALWPASRPELSFLGTGSAPTHGRGDRDNAGFLRPRSTLAIIVIADEDDCSSADRAIFEPDSANSGSPYRSQPLNLRCHYNRERAFPLERYLYGLRDLGERRVVFAALAGVPPDAVDTRAQREVDFGDDAARQAYYQRVLDDPRMQETLDDASGLQGRAPSELKPVCSSALGRAYPGRRFVALAQRWGRDALIRSICADFAGAFDQLAERLRARAD
jgi:hypothetical protein